MERRTFLNQASTLGAGVSLFGIAQHAIAVDPPNIVLGMSLPFTGVASINAQQFREGARILFESVNASGGIHGRRIGSVAIVESGRKELRR
jgi:branched-chain amino acid transport system substrate-binding protein